MTLRRNTLAPGGAQIPLDVIVYGTTDGAIISKLAGEVVQAGTHVIFSNAEIAAAQWPGPPQAGDQIIIDGQTRAILGPPDPKYLATELIVHLCEVKG